MSLELFALSGWGYDERALEFLHGAHRSDLNIQLLDSQMLIDGERDVFNHRAYNSEGPSLYAQSFHRVVQFVREEELVLVGWSLGGFVALEAMLECGVKASKLILISSGARFSGGQGGGQSKSTVRAMRRALNQAPEATLARFYAAAGAPKAPECNKFSVPALEYGLSYLERIDLSARLSEITIPVLIIHGACDEIVSLKEAEFLHERLVRSQLVVLPNAGHLLPECYGPECCLHIEEFLFAGRSQFAVSQ